MAVRYLKEKPYYSTNSLKEISIYQVHQIIQYFIHGQNQIP